MKGYIAPGFEEAIAKLASENPNFLENLMRGFKPVKNTMTEQPTNDLPQLLSRKELAAKLGVHTDSIKRWTRRGLLPCVRINPSLVRYKLEDVKAFLETKSAVS